jgi:hypothetical protein
MGFSLMERMFNVSWCFKTTSKVYSKFSHDSRESVSINYHLEDPQFSGMVSPLSSHRQLPVQTAPSHDGVLPEAL